MPRPRFIEDLAAEMFRTAGRYERTVQGWEGDLYRIFANAERGLFQRRADILTALGVDGGGKLIADAPALQRIEKLSKDIRAAVIMAGANLSMRLRRWRLSAQKNSTIVDSQMCSRTPEAKQTKLCSCPS